MLQIIQTSYLPYLFNIHQRADALPCSSEKEFICLMQQRSGFVIHQQGVLIGCISFSDYIEGVEVTIHCFVDPTFHGKWFPSKKMYQQVFGYCFDELGLQRVTGYSIPGISDAAGAFLLRLGFKHEGTLRNKIRHRDGNFYDVCVYSLLEQERKWR